MGGPGGLGPPGGVLRGRAPLRRVAEDRRSGARGDSSPLLLVIAPHVKIIFHSSTKGITALIAAVSSMFLRKHPSDFWM
jgi:hypothetical protein